MRLEATLIGVDNKLIDDRQRPAVTQHLDKGFTMARVAPDAVEIKGWKALFVQGVDHHTNDLVSHGAVTNMILFDRNGTLGFLLHVVCPMA